MSAVTEPAVPTGEQSARPVVLPPLLVHSIRAGGVRRVALPLSPQPELVSFDGGGSFWSWRPRKRELLDNIRSQWPQALLEFAPYRAGERLWVKETWATVWPAWCGDGRVYDDEHLLGRPIRPEECVIEYRADSLAAYPGEWPEEEARGNPEAPKWRTPLHMPQGLSRLALRVRRVHAEQVQLVTERGALSEGVSRTATGGGQAFTPFPPLPGGARQAGFKRAKEAYASRWQQLYGRRAPWESNPWVWRIDFEIEEVTGG